MKRTVYLFIIIISIFVFAFFCREFVIKNNQRYNDMRQAGIHKIKLKDDLPAIDNDHTDLMGGIVVDTSEGFEHRFFYVSIYNDRVTVFNMYGSICYETGIPMESLELEMRKLIVKGVYFDSIYDANKLIDTLKNDGVNRENR